MGKKKNAKNQQRQKADEKAKRTQRWMGWTLVLILVLCVGAIFYKAVSGPQTGQAVEETEFQYEKQPMLGEKEAPVRVVEFADFKCPSCKQFDQTILPQLKKDFIDQGDVQFYFVNYPIISPNGDSRTAAIAGEAVYKQNPQEFWKFYEAVFDKQQPESTTWATSDFLVQIAKEANLNLDFDQLKKDIDNEAFAQEVDDDEAIGNRAGVNGTPTIFINGREISIQDTFNYDAIKAAIEEAKGGSQ